ncbi:MAG TPA: MFS transporter [Verrucomicrobiota bacterium]|nr:MFS transporter [Verrucomicrobiota bacterium]HRZ55854.1 MFS transporter [Candidatus Paceibacterota bacterium]
MPAPASMFVRPGSPLRGVLSLFAPAPPAAVALEDPIEIKAQYAYWQRRILISTIVGYALYYFVRKNFSIAMPGMGKELGISKADLGLFLTLHGLLYGVSKFANGILGDRTNARTFMAAGLLLSAIVNVFFGFSSTLITLGVLWMLNGWIQGMGFPPCARLMTHWFPPRVLATHFSIWNTSHSIGAGLVVVLCGYLAAYHWRLCFFVPAGLAILGALFLLVSLRDTPPSLGLPEVEGTRQKATDAGFSSALLRQVFGHKYIWLLGMASFCVYSIRYAVLDWGPTFLTEMKHVKLEHSGWMVAAFEVAGVAGMLISGWLTDRVFGGRGARLCVISMVLAGVSILLFWQLASQAVWLNTLLLSLAGFFIYGPQALVGIVVANLATKRLAATAIGFTSIFSYASTLVSGWGLGALVQHHGWDVTLAGLTGMVGLGTLFFALVWPAQVHGYAADAPSPATTPPATTS